MKKYNREHVKFLHRQREKREAEVEEARLLRRRRVIDPDFDEFTKEVREDAAHLQKYIMGGRCKKTTEQKRALLNEFLPSDAPFLAFNNPEARIRFYRAWVSHIQRLGFDTLDFHVTLAPEQFARPLSLACSFDRRSLQAWVRQMLRGYDFIGIVEAAYYSNAGVGETEMIAFHAHLIVFNPDERALRKRVRGLNKDHFPLVGEKMGLVQDIENGTLVGVAKYLAKAPTGEYRAYHRRTEQDEFAWRIRHSSTEEPLDGRKPKQKQKPKKARPGVQLKIREAMQGQYLDKLIFAGGACRELLSDISADLKMGLPWSKRATRQVEHSGCFEARPSLRRNRNGWLRSAYGYHDPAIKAVADQVTCFLDDGG